MAFPRGDAGVSSVFVYWWYDGIRTRIIRRCSYTIALDQGLGGLEGLGMDRVVRTETIVRFPSCIQEIEL